MKSWTIPGRPCLRCVFNERPDSTARPGLIRAAASLLRPGLVTLGVLAAMSLPLGIDSPSRADAQGFRRPARSGITVGGEEFPVVEGPRLEPAPGWPVWLKDFTGGRRTEKTSAIVFAGRDSLGRACFFLGDEVGFFHFCRVGESDAGIEIVLETVDVDRSLREALDGRLHWDFEAMSLDPLAAPARARSALDGSALFPRVMESFLSVEGRTSGEDHRILAVRFVHDRTVSPDTSGRGISGRWRIEARGDAFPGTPFFSRFAGADRGVKGLACGERFLLVGLDNLGRRGDVRVPGSLLYLYDRQRERVAAINTATFGIYSIGGLAAVSDEWTLVADRSRMCLDVLRWDHAAAGSITACHRFPLDLPGPGGFRYGIPNVEGVTLDDRGDIWCVVDPLPGHYRAMTPALPESVYIYMEVGMPMVYRFPGGPVRDAVRGFPGD